MQGNTMAPPTMTEKKRSLLAQRFFAVWDAQWEKPLSSGSSLNSDRRKSLNSQAESRISQVNKAKTVDRALKTASQSPENPLLQSPFTQNFSRFGTQRLGVGLSNSGRVAPKVQRTGASFSGHYSMSHAIRFGYYCSGNR